MLKSILTSCSLLFGIITFGQDLPAEIQKGIEFLDIGELESALELFEKAVKKYPDNAYAYYYLGEAKSRMNPYTGLEEFNQAIQLDSTIAGAYAGRASTFYITDDNYAPCLADMDKAISLDPENWGYYYNRCWLRLSLKNFKGAIADADKAIQLSEDVSGFIYVYKAEALYELGNFKEALQLINQVEEEVGDLDYGFYTTRGKIKVALNDKTGACIDFKHAKLMAEDLAIDLSQEMKLPEELINALILCE